MGMLRGLITLALLLAFIGIVVWSMRRENKDQFDRAARIPLEDAAPDPAANAAPGARKQ